MASQFTTQQLQTLKQWVITNAASVFDESTAALLNAVAVPEFFVYRRDVELIEIIQNQFDWTRVDNLTVGKARIWEWMFDNDDRSINAENPAIRSGINEVWKGTAPDLAIRAIVYSHCVKPATVAEKLFATGAGTAPDVDGNGPGTRAAGTGPVTVNDLIEADNS